MRKKAKVKIGSKEDIVAIEHYYAGRFVRARIAHGEIDPKDPDHFIMTENQTVEDVMINQENYEELMKANPKTNKPKGVFRKDDLWPFIDKARGVK